MTQLPYPFHGHDFLFLLFSLTSDFFLMELFGFAPQCTEPIGNYFSAAEAGFIVLLCRGHGWVKASRHDLHLFTLSWSSFMWQRWPPLSFRINLASSNSFSFCKKLGTETVVKKFCYENVVGALAILFNRVVYRWNQLSNILLVLTEWYKVN